MVTKKEFWGYLSASKSSFWGLPSLPFLSMKNNFSKFRVFKDKKQVIDPNKFRDQDKQIYDPTEILTWFFFVNIANTKRYVKCNVWVSRFLNFKGGKGKIFTSYCYIFFILRVSVSHNNLYFNRDVKQRSLGRCYSRCLAEMLKN